VIEEILAYNKRFVEEKAYTAFNAGSYDYQMVPQEQFDGLIYIDHLEK